MPVRTLFVQASVQALFRFPVSSPKKSDFFGRDSEEPAVEMHPTSVEMKRRHGKAVQAPLEAPMPVPNDIVKRAAQGERAAQEQIYHLLSERLFRLVKRIVGASEADDVTQEVFVNLFRKLHTFRFDADFATWAHRLAVNDALQHVRRARRRATVPLDATPAVASEHERVSDAQETFSTAFSRLETEHQLILELKEVEKSSYAEIAQTLGIPEGTVGSRLNRARSELRKRMIELGWE